MIIHTIIILESARNSFFACSKVKIFFTIIKIFVYVPFKKIRKIVSGYFFSEILSASGYLYIFMSFKDT